MRMSPDHKRKLSDSQPNRKPRPPKEVLVEMHKTMSGREIARHFNVTQLTQRNWFKYYGIKPKTYKDNKMPVPKGSVMPKAHREAISKANTGRKGKRGDD